MTQDKDVECLFAVILQGSGVGCYGAKWKTFSNVWNEKHHLLSKNMYDDKVLN